MGIVGGEMVGSRGLPKLLYGTNVKKYCIFGGGGSCSGGEGENGHTLSVLSNPSIVLSCRVSWVRSAIVIAVVAVAVEVVGNWYIVTIN